VSVGRWGWLHARTLVEEHARGRCLFRVSTRLRLSVRGALLALATTVGLGFASLAAMSLHRPSGRIVSAVALAVLVARTAWQATRTAAVVDRALLQTMQGAGLVPVPPRATTSPVDAHALHADAPEGYHATRGV
jgi:hypothetical protein